MKGAVLSSPKLSIVLPCCSSKNGHGKLEVDPVCLAHPGFLPHSGELGRGRQVMLPTCMDSDAEEVSAGLMYSGHMYTPDVHDMIREGKADFLILSAGYGVLHCSEMARPYEKVLDQTALRHWRRYNVGLLIAEFLLSRKFDAVVGFFSDSSLYSELLADAAHALKLKVTLQPEVYYYTVVSGGSTGSTPQMLRTILKGLYEEADQPLPFLNAHKSVCVGQATANLMKLHPEDPNNLAETCGTPVSLSYNSQSDTHHSPEPTGRLIQSKYAPLAKCTGQWITKEQADGICKTDTAGLFRKSNKNNQDRIAGMFAAADLEMQASRAVHGQFVTIKIEAVSPKPGAELLDTANPQHTRVCEPLCKDHVHGTGPTLDDMDLKDLERLISEVTVGQLAQDIGGKYAPLAQHLDVWITKPEADEICGTNTHGLFTKQNRPNQNRVCDDFRAAGLQLVIERHVAGPYIRLRTNRIREVCDEGTLDNPRSEALPPSEPRELPPAVVDAAMLRDQALKSKADLIRAYLCKVIGEARAGGSAEITLRSGDVHRTLRLQRNLPNVCQVMRGNKLLKGAAVVLAGVKGPVPSSNAVFTYIINSPGLDSPLSISTGTGNKSTQEVRQEEKEGCLGQDVTSDQCPQPDEI